MSDSTEARRANAAKARAAWEDNGKRQAHKGAGKKGSGVPKLPKVPLEPDELLAILEACGTSTTGLRNRAMVALLYGAGIRIAEACALMPSDVKVGPPAVVRVVSGKGDKSREAGVGGPMVPHLVAWQERRKALGLNGRQPFICAVSAGSRGNRTSPDYWRHWLPRIAAKAGIEGKRVHPHALRLAHATHMMTLGVTTLDDIRDQLGHGNIATTSAYLAGSATPERLQRVHQWGQPEDEVADLSAHVVSGTPPPLPYTPEQLAAMSPEQIEAATRGTVSAWLAARGEDA